MSYVDELIQKYFVIKCDDLPEFLNTKDVSDLKRILFKIIAGRGEAGRKQNDYVVINLDEPYMEEIKEVMVRNGHWG